MARVYAVCFWLGMSLCGPVSANNGFNFIGFGTESLSMGGADIAVARDTTALNTNPAGLSGMGKRWDLYNTLTHAVDVRHSDALGNDQDSGQEWIPSGGFGIARPIGGSRLSGGLGVFVQGGAGNEFDDLLTQFGTRDELSAELAVLKLSAGLAYEVDPRLHVGVSLAAVVGRLEQTLLPNTSVLIPGVVQFFGVDAKDLTAVSVSPLFGVQYRASDTLTLAATFAPETKLSFEDGEATVNMSAAGLGRVNYGDVKLDGLALPASANVGLAWRPRPRTLIAVEVGWLDWSGALNSQTLTATNPGTAGAPGSVSRTTPLNWRDQYVLALGVAQEVFASSTLYLGFNYARNPIPPETLTPLFSPAIAQTHLTGGLAYRFGGGRWILSTGVVYVFPEEVTYSNPSLPFGAQATERIEYLGVNAMLGHTW